jgi:peptide/nickel transport system substrate-binding protein
MPSGFTGSVDLEVPTYDLDKAREYLAQTPWPDGGITLDYVYVTDFAPEEIPGLMLLEGLAEINIELNMIPMLWPDMVASCGSPDTGPDLINIYTLTAYMDPDAVLYNQYHSDQWGSFNSCNFYQNDNVNGLLDKARVEPDFDARLGLYAQVQEELVADQPAIWMYTEDQLLGFDDRVQGFLASPVYPITVLFQDLWLTE